MTNLMEVRKRFADDAAPYQKTRSADNNAFGGIVTSDGGYVKVGRWACHGWLQGYNLEAKVPYAFNKKGGIKYILSAVMKPHVTEDKLRRFIDWLVHRSPWADIFVDKDIDSILTYGHLVDANFPTSFIVSGMIASRFVTESYSGDEIEKRCAVYQELLDIGCTENEAFFFAHMYNVSNVKKVYPITFSRYYSGHATFYASDYQEDYVRNFLRGTPANVGKNMLCDCKGYESDSVNALWAKRSEKSDAFGERVQSLRPASKAVKQDFHIFRKALSNGFEYKDREDFASVIQQLRGLLNA